MTNANAPNGKPMSHPNILVPYWAGDLGSPEVQARIAADLRANLAETQAKLVEQIHENGRLADRLNRATAELAAEQRASAEREALMIELANEMAARQRAGRQKPLQAAWRLSATWVAAPSRHRHLRRVLGGF